MDPIQSNDDENAKTLQTHKSKEAVSEQNPVGLASQNASQQHLSAVSKTRVGLRVDGTHLEHSNSSGERVQRAFSLEKRRLVYKKDEFETESDKIVR